MITELRTAAHVAQHGGVNREVQEVSGPSEAECSVKLGYADHLPIPNFLSRRPGLEDLSSQAESFEKHCLLPVRRCRRDCSGVEGETTLPLRDRIQVADQDREAFRRWWYAFDRFAGPASQSGPAQTRSKVRPNKL